jgi:hypothetical protein
MRLGSDAMPLVAIAPSSFFNVLEVSDIILLVPRISKLEDLGHFFSYQYVTLVVWRDSSLQRVAESAGAAVEVPILTDKKK